MPAQAGAGKGAAKHRPQRAAIAGWGLPAGGADGWRQDGEAVCGGAVKLH